MKADRLRRRFPKVAVVQSALSDHDGTTKFFIDPEASGYSSLAEGNGKIEVTVPVTRLDAIVTEPDFVKIDVEGAELGVLLGATNLKSRPIYFESGAQEILGYTKAALWEWFQRNDYGLFLPNRLAQPRRQ